MLKSFLQLSLNLNVQHSIIKVKSQWHIILHGSIILTSIIYSSDGGRIIIRESDKVMMVSEHMADKFFILELVTSW